MSSKLKVLQVIPRLGYGGAETGCYDLAHYLHEQKCKSYILTSGGELIKYIDRKKVKLALLQKKASQAQRNGDLISAGKYLSEAEVLETKIVDEANSK